MWQAKITLPTFAEEWTRPMRRVRHNIRNARDRMKMTYDVGSSQTPFQSGDRKLQSSWEGPYEFVKKINDVIYQIKKANGGERKVVHFNRLAPFARDNGEAQIRQLERLSPELNFEDFKATYTGTTKARFGMTREEHRDLFTEKSYQKPTYRTVWEALLNLREKLLTADVLKLAIPKLADGTAWIGESSEAC
nr:unnamed protein product [Callosobruchus analis]